MLQSSGFRSWTNHVKLKLRVLTIKRQAHEDLKMSYGQFAAPKTKLSRAIMWYHTRWIDKRTAHRKTTLLRSSVRRTCSSGADEQNQQTGCEGDFVSVLTQSPFHALVTTHCSLFLVQPLSQSRRLSAGGLQRRVARWNGDNGAVCPEAGAEDHYI